jgi:hypothetical protein
MAIPRTSPARPPVTFLSSCARRSQHTSVDQTEARNALLKQYPKSAKEASSWWIGKIHLVHLRRLLDVRLPIIKEALAKATGRN